MNRWPGMTLMGRVSGWLAQPLRALLAIVAACVLLASFGSPAKAELDPRTVTITEEVMVEHWQLLRWKNGQLLCDIYSREQQGPAAQEVINSCGMDVYLDWLKTPACTVGPCKGLMLHYVGKEKRTLRETVSLPRISMKLETGACIPGQSCEQEPVLQLAAKEPVQGYSIKYIYLRTKEHQWRWDGADIQYNLPITTEGGQWIEYWAESDFGDESDHVRIKYRSLLLDPDASIYRLDILGDAWRKYAASGSMLWYLFPPLDGSLPTAFEQPLSADYLYTTNRFVFLASYLIKDHRVDAKSCPGGGLFSNGSATVCGEQAAAATSLAWQNQFDTQIFKAAVRHNVPARVLKGIIGQETQFWREHENPQELGLGMITENGLDMLLVWYPKYFLSICIPKYKEERCSAGYGALSEPEQLVIKGELWKKIGTDEEFDLLAAMLLASAAQSGQLVQNTTGGLPDEAASYTDMWKLTIANYYAGSGCMGDALEDLVDEEEAITWEELANALQDDCRIAIDYVSRVLELAK